MRTTKDSKRILSVIIKRITDTDADTSDLGKFSDREPEQYAIVAQGEYVGQFVDSLPCECGHPEADHDPELGTCAECLALECETFDRVSVHGDSRLAKYFNPCADNYAGIEDAELRRYCLQDYERMRDLEAGEWYYVGIKAQAQVLLGKFGPVQVLTSGGIWGIESDSDPSDFRSIEREQLDELRDQLHAIGFTKRAVAAAFRTIDRKED